MTAGVMHYPPRLDQPGDLVQRGRVSLSGRPRKPSGPATQGGLPKQTQSRSGAGVWPISKPFWAIWRARTPVPGVAQFPTSVPERVFSLKKNTLQLRQLQELTPEEHAEGVVDIRSPGWSEAQPWVLNVNRRPALKGRQRVASACPRMLG